MRQTGRPIYMSHILNEGCCIKKLGRANKLPCACFEREHLPATPPCTVPSAANIYVTLTCIADVDNGLHSLLLLKRLNISPDIYALTACVGVRSENNLIRLSVTSSRGRNRLLFWPRSVSGNIQERSLEEDEMSIC